jgi:hypothetical protein
MNNLMKKVMVEDVRVWNPSTLLWRLEESKPEIRQIYGHFLPPYHMKLVNDGLVAKDFNFPAAYHTFIGLSELNELFEIGEKLKSDTIMQLNDFIKIRVEETGAIVYTPYFNGFYVNRSAYKILECLKVKMSIDDIVSKSGYNFETVVDFLARILALGIVNVSS